MMRMRPVIMLAVCAALTVVALGAAVYALTRPAPPNNPDARTLAVALAAQAPGFSPVLSPRLFVFPQDHGPHHDYALEWWYYTGNLATQSGRHFGYQLTFFRIGLTPQPAQRTSDWAAEHVYLSHFAVTDTQNRRFHASERSSRSAMGLAGASSEPFRVWVEDWSAASDTNDTSDTLPIRLRAAADGIAIDLLLHSAKLIVLQGEDGFSRKGNAPGSASYYYSYTRMPTSGTISVDGGVYSVSGASWMDREWSTALLSDEYVGWDWFALQLDDGRELLYFRLRPHQSGGEPFEYANLIRPDGSAAPIDAAHIQVDELARWESPLGGSYPSRWRIRIPSQDVDLRVVPYIANQELDTSVRYWEGAVRVESGGRVVGSGYVELTGYGEDAGGRS